MRACLLVPCMPFMSSSFSKKGLLDAQTGVKFQPPAAFVEFLKHAFLPFFTMNTTFRSPGNSMDFRPFLLCHPSDTPSNDDEILLHAQRRFGSQNRDESDTFSDFRNKRGSRRSINGTVDLGSLAVGAADERRRLFDSLSSSQRLKHAQAAGSVCSSLRYFGRAIVGTCSLARGKKKRNVSEGSADFGGDGVDQYGFPVGRAGANAFAFDDDIAGFSDDD